MTTHRFRIQFGMALMIMAGTATSFAQHLGFPTAGVPKLDSGTIL